jgi:hypothetical protein
MKPSNEFLPRFEPSIPGIKTRSVTARADFTQWSLHCMNGTAILLLETDVSKFSAQRT